MIIPTEMVSAKRDIMFNVKSVISALGHSVVVGQLIVIAMILGIGFFDSGCT